MPPKISIQRMRHCGCLLFFCILSILSQNLWSIRKLTLLKSIYTKFIIFILFVFKKRYFKGERSACTFDDWFKNLHNLFRFFFAYRIKFGWNLNVSWEVRNPLPLQILFPNLFLNPQSAKLVRNSWKVVFLKFITLGANLQNK